MTRTSIFSKVWLSVLACAGALAAQSQEPFTQRLAFEPASAQQVAATVEPLEVDLDLIKVPMPRHTSLSALTHGKAEAHDTKLSDVEAQEARRIEVNLEDYMRQSFEPAHSH